MTRQFSFLSISLSLYRKQTRLQILLTVFILPFLTIWFKAQNVNLQLIVKAYPVTILLLLLSTLCKGLKFMENQSKCTQYQTKGQEISFLEKIQLIIWMFLHISLSQYQSFAHIMDFSRLIIILSKFQIYLGIFLAFVIYVIPCLLCLVGNFIIINRKFQIRLQSIWYENYNPNGYCIICLQNETQIKLSCSHEYHLACISKSTQVIPKCPLCFKRIVFP